MSIFRPPFWCIGLILPAWLLTGADAIKSKSTYKEAYGPSKAPLAVDPAKDLPRYPAVDPKKAIATWKVKKGFKMEFDAHEPQVRSPIAISYDERGRMFVCEMIDYSEMRDVTPHLGRISMLEDKDGDGYYETSTVFADDLPWPTGLICANGGVYVIATPDIYFFKDTKGTGHADLREVVYTGFGTGLKVLNVQGLANCPQWGSDNRIHIQAGGGNRGKIKCLKRPDLPEVELGGRDFWFDPRTYEFGLEAGGAQYGMGFDNFGRRFACSNSDHLQFFVYDDRYAARNPFFAMPSPRQSIAADGGAAEVYRVSPDEPWRIIRTRWRIAGVVKGMVEGGGRVSGYFTGATGTMVYRGDVYGDDFLGNTFTGDAGGQLVHRKKIYPDGVSLIGRRPADEQNFEFAASTDTWVRPVDFTNGPDGCLHVMDMYREVIEHPWSIPDEIKKHLDLNSGNDRGRIYRIVPDNPGWKRRPRVDLSKAAISELVETLEHPNGWHRDCAARLIYERQDKAAVPLLEKLAAGGATPLGRFHALCALDGLNALSKATVFRALQDSNAFVREHAVLLSEKLFHAGVPAPEIVAWLRMLTLDPEKRVRFQLAFTLGELNGPGNPANDSIVALARNDHDDPWMRAALLSDCKDRTSLIFGSLVSGGPLEGRPAADLLIDCARMIGAKNDRAEVAAVIDEITKWKNPVLLLRALGEGLKRAGVTIAKVDTEKKLDAVFGKAGETTKDAKTPVSSRIQAISLLSLATPQQAQPALFACLNQSQPENLQAAAIAALGYFSGADATEALIAHWPGLHKQARTAAFAVLQARPERAVALLHAIESEKIAAADLTASDVQALFKHKDPQVAALADKVLAALKPPSRESVIAKFQPALTSKGDAGRGQLIYTQRCIACHRANQLGVQVGPDLITVKTKGREGIMVAILDPNKEVAPQYIAYTVNTKDGQTLLGIITNDSASSMTLKMMGGVEVNVPRSNIKGSSAAGLSLMPEGIEAGISIQDMSDLLDFIESLK